MRHASGTVLIQVGEILENRQRTLALARACKDAGWTPVMLLTTDRCENFFLEAGIDAIAINRFRPSRFSPWLPLRQALGRLTVDSVCCGVRLGDICRFELAKIPAAARAVRVPRLLLRTAKEIYALDAIVRAVDPQVIGVWNGHTGLVANTLRTLVEQKRAEAFYMERGLMPGSLFVDPRGTNGASLLAALAAQQLAPVDGGETWVQLKALVDPVAVDGERQLALRQAHGLGEKKIVFVPLQVESDTNIQLYSPNIKKMRQLCLASVDAMRRLRRPDVVVVVRPHPEEEAAVKLNLPQIDGMIVSSDGRLEDWIDAAAVVVTVNSTVGLQAAVRNRPTAVLGRAIYSGKGFTHDVSCHRLADVIAARIDAGILTVRELKNLERFLRHLVGRQLVLADHHARRQTNIAVVERLIGRPAPAAPLQPKVFNAAGVDPRGHAAEMLKRRAAFAQAVTTARCVDVLLAVDHRAGLGLTYRKVNVPVTPERIRQIVRPYVGADDIAISYIRERDRLDRGRPVLMVSDKPDAGRRRAERAPITLSIDAYGSPHIRQPALAR